MTWTMTRTEMVEGSAKFTDETEAAMSTQRQIKKLRAPIIVT